MPDITPNFKATRERFAPQTQRNQAKLYHFCRALLAVDRGYLVGGCR